MTVMEQPPRADQRAPEALSCREEPQIAATGKGPRWPLMLGVVLAAAAGGWFFLGQQPAPLPAPAAAATRNPGEFRLSETEMRGLRIEPVHSLAFRPERVAAGRIVVNDDRATPMFAPYTGRVTRAFARVGDRVEAGAPLYEIETPDVTAAANDLLAALDNVQKTRTALDQARREDARQASLLSARAASQRDLEQARAAVSAAEAEARSAASQLDATRDRLRVLGRSPAEVTQIEQARLVSGLITVTAPLTGTVTQRRVGPGQWLQAGQGEAVFTIADLSTVWLVAQVREMDAPVIRVGQPVQVEVGALPGRGFEARLVRSAAGLDPATRRLTVMAEVQDPEGLLRPEMFATFRISVGDQREAPAVPASAAIFRGAEAHVWVALPENRFELRRIEAGLRQDGMIEARAGIAAGERLVTGGALFIDRASRTE
jgi:cobalt-zinc-cadmium efflux system membrane fusion protein